AGRKEYTYLPLNSSTTHPQTSWERALSQAATGKLGDALTAFESLTKENPKLSSAWYNVGLTRAWLGDNSATVDALDQYVKLEPDEGGATKAWALAEVLHYGLGMEDRADWREHGVIYQIRDPRALANLINEWAKSHRLVALQPDEEQ